MIKLLRCGLVVNGQHSLNRSPDDASLMKRHHRARGEVILTDDRRTVLTVALAAIFANLASSAERLRGERLVGMSHVDRE